MHSEREPTVGAPLQPPQVPGEVMSRQQRRARERLNPRRARINQWDYDWGHRRHRSRSDDPEWRLRDQRIGS